MKLVKTEDAIGAVLCHDITQIIKGVTKDAVFRKGHIIREEDIPVLLSCGKENVYVLELGNPKNRKEDGVNGTGGAETDSDYEAEYGRGMLHENEAADFLCDMCRGMNLRRGNVKEGKIELSAECDGLLKVDEKGVLAVNSAGEMMIASRHGNFPVKAGDKVAGTRIIPLVIEERKLLAVKKKISELQAYQTGSDITKNDSCENDNNCKNDNNCENDINYGQNAGNTDIKIRPFYNVLPFKHKKAAIIATGSEVKKGLIKDTFTPVIEAKLAEYDTEIVYKALPGDEHEKITQEIMKAVKEYDADIVLCTGGMSVDPDDRTPLAIRNTGARIVCYGAPVLPGAMFMLGYYEPVDEESCDNRGKDTVVRNEEGYRTGAAPNEESCGCRGIDTAVRKKVAVMGLPGCVMFHGRTVFDLVLPRIMADDEVFPEEIAALGTGGLCLNCGTCTFPNCGFGK